MTLVILGDGVSGAVSAVQGCENAHVNIHC